MSHPFFQLLRSLHSDICIMTSHFAMKETRYLAGEVVFQEGCVANELIYVLAGHLDYYSSIMGMNSVTLRHGEWACQPALWLKWVHCGRLMARTSSEVVGVDVNIFLEIIQDLQVGS